MRMQIIATLALTLASCASFLGVDPAKLDSANKALAAATVQIEALTTLTNDLLSEGVIGPSEARVISTNLRTGLDAVQKAKDAVAASGDPSQADAALEIAERSIDVTLRLLQSFSPRTNAVFERNVVKWKPPQLRKSLADCLSSFEASPELSA